MLIITTLCYFTISLVLFPQNLQPLLQRSARTVLPLHIVPWLKLLVTVVIRFTRMLAVKLARQLCATSVSIKSRHEQFEATTRVSLLLSMCQNICCVTCFFFFQSFMPRRDFAREVSLQNISNSSFADFFLTTVTQKLFPRGYS